MTNANGQAGSGAARPEAPKLLQAALILLGQAPGWHAAAACGPAGARQKMLQALLKAALVAEVPAAEAAQGWRRDESGRFLGLVITAAGYRAVGLPIAWEEQRRVLGFA